MPEFNRVRPRVLWQDGNYRMIRYLVVWGYGDGTWEAPEYSRPIVYWQIEQLTDTGVWDVIWDARAIHPFDGHDYLYGNRKQRRQITRRYAQVGRDWLTRHKQLLAAEAWVIQGGNVDGLGNPCPLLRNGNCVVCKWWGDGYVANGGSRACPGECDAPWYQTSFPQSYDKFGNSIDYYRDIVKSKELVSRSLRPAV